MFDLFWDLHQHRPIGDTNTSNDVSDQTNVSPQAVRELRATVDKLSLICMAMWSLLRERSGITDTDLIQRVQDMDLQDGVADGKLAPPPIICPNCERRSSVRHRNCIYCGASLAAATTPQSLAQPPALGGETSLNNRMTE